MRSGFPLHSLPGEPVDSIPCATLVSVTSDFERVGLGAVRVLLLTCATVGAAVGQRGADAAAERVEAAFRRGDPVEARAARLEAVTAVPASGSAALVEVLCDAWTACHHMALKVEREVLDQNRRGGAKRAADERETFDALLATMWAIEGRLERFDDPAAAAALFECGVLDDDLAPQLRVIAAAAAGPMGKAGAERVAAQLTRARRADDRWILLRALQAIGGAARFAGPDVSEQLTHESTMVRSQAARTLAAIGHRPSAKAMIDRLDVERGQAQRVLMASLVVLAKRDLGPVPASWRAWWQAEGEDFVAGRLPPPKQVEGARAKGEPRTVTFFGVPQDDRRILYVLDASLSMRQKLSGSGRAKAGEESRWDRLLVEARKAFEGLSPEQEFGVLVFGDTMQAWQPKLVPATPRE